MTINLNLLLDKYWEGETSIEDEATILDYFRVGNIADEHLQFKDYFEWIMAQQGIQSHSDTDMDILLEKYWDASASEKEEAILRAYFKSGHIHESHLPYADLFGFFEDQKEIEYPTPVIQLPANTDIHIKENQNSTKSQTRIIPILIKVAAVFVLVAGALFVINNMINPSVNSSATAHVYEVEDPEEALRITKEALALVSNKFRESQEPLKENLNTINHINIFKAK